MSAPALSPGAEAGLKGVDDGNQQVRTSQTAIPTHNRRRASYLIAQTKDKLGELGDDAERLEQQLLEFEALLASSSQWNVDNVEASSRPSPGVCHSASPPSPSSRPT